MKYEDWAEYNRRDKRMFEVGDRVRFVKATDKIGGVRIADVGDTGEVTHVWLGDYVEEEKFLDVLLDHGELQRWLPDFYVEFE